MAKPKRTVKPKKVLEPVIDNFSLSLKLGTEVYESSGETVLEALSKLEKPIKINLKGVLTLSQGEKRKEMLFYPLQLKRLFFPDARPSFAKRLAIGLK